jgi:DNA-binding GntR family transcriptional regulator
VLPDGVMTLCSRSSSTVGGEEVRQALQQLRELIVSGDVCSSDDLQADLARRTGLTAAPIRQALRSLEQEGQVTYQPGCGYYLVSLPIEDLRETYDLRRILETHAVRVSLLALDGEALERIRCAAADCADAVDGADVASELEANRRFHFAILGASRQPHTIRIIRLLWDATEPYRALYYNAPEERRAALDAHDRILDAIGACDVERLIVELDRHRQRALDVLEKVLARRPPAHS